MIPKT